MKEGFLVVGLGTLGWQAAVNLHRARTSVLAIDLSQEVIDSIQSKVTKAVCVDATDFEALKSIGALEMKHALISLPHNFDSAVIITYHLKKNGFKTITVRVETEHQMEAIKAVGATSTVFPERDTALALVRSMVYPSLADEIPLGEDFAILELPCPEVFGGKSLVELNLRRKHQVSLIAIKKPSTESQQEQVRVSPNPEEALSADWNLLVLGTHKRLARFKDWVTTQDELSKKSQQSEE